MWQWIIVGLLILEGHFAASYLVPLDGPSQREFGGALRWFWPWSDGDHGPLGAVTVANGFPIAGFYLAVTAAALLVLAAMGVLHWWVPPAWWRPLAGVGAVLSVVLMALFFGPTKLLPITLNLVVLWLVVSDRVPVAAQ